MNDRIRELFLQADFPKVDIENEAERFALSIIGECCVALNPMLRDMISRGQTIELIKQHFGVK